ncbi:MAG: putative Formimidoyltransferase-cyclodeaminase [Nitrospira sp.]|nr:putative Formimidoyltransferase-cyclodeaminase [Nitrospira sp.]
MDRIIECVPNFSEGRSQATVQALIDAVASVPGVRLLNHTADRDHHRSVLTIVGDPEEMVEAMFRSIRVATDLIDLRRHSGVHPRVGATDVVPFVPIKGLSMRDCVKAAKRLGHRVGAELEIPVFLYEHAASHRDHAALESVRRGGLEGLAFRMATDPDWSPDFGPSRLHETAGAIVIGARPPLVAFNVNLLSTDVNVARSIAGTIRQSNGGIPHLKAIGVELASRGMVQVAMNLTDYEATPLHAAFTAVQSQAAERGVSVAGTEIVGLVPLAAIVETAKEALRLEYFEPMQLLETQIEAAWSRGEKPKGRTDVAQPFRLPVPRFIEAVAAPAAVPGGGAVAALVGALASALGMMGAGLSRQPATERRLKDIVERLSYLLQADGEAYRTFVEATRRPKTDDHRPTLVSSALHVATEIPLEIAEQSAKAGTLLHACSRGVKARLQSDMQVGLILAIAAAEAGLHTAMENVKIQPNHRLRESLAVRIRRLSQNLEELKVLCYTPRPGRSGKHSAQALPGKVRTRDEWKSKSSITTSRKRSKLRRKSLPEKGSLGN